MTPFNQFDLLAIRQFDIEHKVILPTSKLYAQVNTQVNSLVQDIRSVLIDSHNLVASSAKEVYANPVATLTYWYDLARAQGTNIYIQFQTNIRPIGQQWQDKIVASREKTTQYLQAFWDNPEQVAANTLEPVMRYATSISANAEHQLQLFVDNPEQFMASAVAPLTTYLTSLTESAKAALISHYYALSDLASLLKTQPATTLKSVYHNALSSLLDVYFDVISSFLVIS
ncbi:MAG: hypothetical protein HOP23_05525 [Methylococcaceae bacterium]|nr:hypothetical protein [Methylococcaceae bacterium]